ncbi:hypothetical protein GOODEAATRI_002607 [Goodea atripinnis]|uniref:Uncharacterized protein n=1 Tax=Goodea atripinnis TaxID=208336 RepID=A0ABV0PAW7_9TELE
MFAASFIIQSCLQSPQKNERNLEASQDPHHARIMHYPRTFHRLLHNGNKQNSLYDVVSFKFPWVHISSEVKFAGKNVCRIIGLIKGQPMFTRGKRTVKMSGILTPTVLSS